MKMMAAMVLGFGVVTAAVAQHQTFAVNADASEVRMTLKTNHDVVHGDFHVQSGAIEFERSGGKIAGSVVVAAGSGKTGNDTRDKKMNKEILKTDQFTTVTFMPKSYTGTIPAVGNGVIQVLGVMTLLGAAHEIAVPMQVQIVGERCTVKAHFAVPYVAWGVKSPNFLIFKAENEVGMDLTLVGVLGR